MGAESHRVTINAATMRINFLDRRSPAGTTTECKTPVIRKWPKRNEGTDDKCPAVAVARTGYFRTVLCPYANTPGRTHPGDTAHTFPSSPWDTLNGPLLRRVYNGQRVAVRRRQPPWLSSVGQANTPSSHSGLAAKSSQALSSWVRLRS